jgi:hypothetical protein
MNGLKQEILGLLSKGEKMVTESVHDQRLQEMIRKDLGLIRTMVNFALAHPKTLARLAHDLVVAEGHYVQDQNQNLLKIAAEGVHERIQSLLGGDSLYED